MKKNQKKVTKNSSCGLPTTISTEVITPYSEKPSKDAEGLAAHDLFSLFTAGIIQENVAFTR